MSENSNDASGEKGLRPHRSLAAALSPLQTSLVGTQDGWALELTPISSALIAQTWSARVGFTGVNLLYDAEQSDWRDGNGPSSLAGIVRRLGIDPVTQIDDEILVLDDSALGELLSVVAMQHLRITRVDGPIEPRDATAIVSASARNESPLGIEMRAVAAARIRNDRHVILQMRDRFDALAMVAGSFRTYMAQVLQRPVRQLTPPPLWQLERLLSVSGTLTVRPIETEIYSSSVDIGISTRGHGEQEPADCSLVFDVHSRTWHDED
jgi:hypothetical protein